MGTENPQSFWSDKMSLTKLHVMYITLDRHFNVHREYSFLLQINELLQAQKAATKEVCFVPLFCLLLPYPFCHKSNCIVVMSSYTTTKMTVHGRKP